MDYFKFTWFEDGTIKFYTRFVDDTLVLAKPCDFDRIQFKLNSFHSQLKFTREEFQNDVHFLDILLTNGSTTIYRKSTHTGQYVHIDSFEPWFMKIAWVRSLMSPAYKICSTKEVLQNSNVLYLNFSNLKFCSTWYFCHWWCGVISCNFCISLIFLSLLIIICSVKGLIFIALNSLPHTFNLFVILIKST